MTKQSLFEAREKLSHTAFIDLNQNTFLRDYAYSDNNYKTFYGYRLSAVDGCIFDVPAGATEFGAQKTNGESAPQAQAAVFVDVLSSTYCVLSFNLVVVAKLILYVKCFSVLGNRNPHRHKKPVFV